MHASSRPLSGSRGGSDLCSSDHSEILSLLLALLRRARRLKVFRFKTSGVKRMEALSHAHKRPSERDKSGEVAKQQRWPQYNFFLP